MDKPHILSGDEIVARGITKLDGALPEAGLKDVVPNGSWLEQKQIQSALEARKHLIEVERIEKCGVLSYADWHEDLMLAKVTKQAGGHWQYVGHNIGKQLYLRPEEALFLMEMNCLQLRYNEVTVSLQQAYSLLLRSNVTTLQYKVYSSLSRLGYKVFMYQERKPTGHEKKLITDEKLHEENKDEENIKMEVGSSEGENTENCNASNGNQCSLKDNNFREKKNVKLEIEVIEAQSVAEAVSSTDQACDESTLENVSNINKEDSMAQENEAMETEDYSQNIKNHKDVPDTNDPELGETTQNSINKLEFMTQDCEAIEKEEHRKSVETESKNVPELGKTAQVITNTGEVEFMAQDESETVEKEEHSQSTRDHNEIFNLNGPELEKTVQYTRKINKVELTTDDNEAIEVENHSQSLQSEHNDTRDTELMTGVINIETDSVELSQDIVNQGILAYNHKLHKLVNRQCKPCDSKQMEKSFENIPDLVENQIVTISVPDEQYLPRNVFLNNLQYVLNLESIRERTKDARPDSTELRPYSVNEEANGEHIRRLRDSNIIPSNNWASPNFNQRYMGPNFQFRPQLFRPNFNIGIPFNIFLQRPFMFNMNMNFMHRFRPFFTPQPSPPRFPMNPPSNYNSDSTHGRKRKYSQAKQNHLDAIKQLAARLKQLIQSGAQQDQNIIALQNLINTFNTRYGSALRLSDSFDITEQIVETISLDDDEESTSKRPRKENDKYTENLNKLKQVARKLQQLKSTNKVCSRHRRAFSKLLKKFNKSYNAELYMNSNYEVIDKKFINLDSSSDSDCIVEETPKTSCSKKLKNPFNIIKRLAEKQSTNVTQSESTNADDNKYEELKSIFGENWLPPENDFGRAELAQRNLGNEYLLSKQDEFLFDFIKSQPFEFTNWLDIKISFLKSLEESSVMMVSHNQNTESVPEINSIIDLEDCKDTASVLNKLSIIKADIKIDAECNLSVDFDVYNRDVQNFRKTNPPKPHFRVICVSESSTFPSGMDVASLHSKYTDEVPIVFAIVGLGSVSYLQVNPIDLPVYIPSNDLT